MVAPAATVGVLGAATLALHLRDPHQSGSWGYCPFAMLGLACPGCGGLRAVNDLTRGDVGAAASSNLLAVALVPLVVVGLAFWALRRWRGDERPMSGWVTPAVVWVSVAVLLAFTVLRNLPAGAWLAP
jgi:hypothetical protein